MLVVDLMHEVELNVWKAVFVHLLRILDCQDEALKHDLDSRYCTLKPAKRHTVRLTAVTDFVKYLPLGLTGYGK